MRMAFLAERDQSTVRLDVRLLGTPARAGADGAEQRHRGITAAGVTQLSYCPARTKKRAASRARMKWRRVADELSR
jgi:hypothetical protein